MSKTKSEAFAAELKLITETDLFEFIKKALTLVPDYFYEVPASSSGKYHSSTCLGRSGLIRHTKAAVMIAHDLFRVGCYSHYSEREQQIIIISLILHDSFKCGENGKVTVTEHPLIAGDFVETNKELDGIISDEERKTMARLIRSHMGIWNKDYRSQKEVLPVPKEDDEWFVHLCDYMASRSYLNYVFPDGDFVLQEHDLSEDIDKIISLCKSILEKDKINKEDLYRIIATHNGGRRNPNSIKDKETAEAILSEIKAAIGEEAE